MIKEHNKLVRDKIVDIIESSNKTAKTRILNDNEYKIALKEKLFEEIEEYFASENDVNELADIKEVFNALCIANGHSVEEVENARLKKAIERGAFNKKIFLIQTIEN